MPQEKIMHTGEHFKVRVILREFPWLDKYCDPYDSFYCPQVRRVDRGLLHSTPGIPGSGAPDALYGVSFYGGKYLSLLGEDGRLITKVKQEGHVPNPNRKWWHLGRQELWQSGETLLQTIVQLGKIADDIKFVLQLTPFPPGRKWKWSNIVIYKTPSGFPGLGQWVSAEIARIEKEATAEVLGC